MPPLENWEKGLASGPESFKWDRVNSLLVLQTVRNRIHHVSLLPQACGGSHWDHQEGDPWRWLRGQICGQKVSLFAFLCCLVRCSKKQYRDIHLCIVWFDNAFNVCISVDHLHVRLFYRCYWGFHGHYSREAEHLFQALESTYQKALQSHLKSSDSIVSLPQSDRSSSSSQESLK